MKTRLLVALMLISLLAGVLFIAVPIRPAAANDVQLSVNPSLVSKSPSDVNSFFDVFVDITNVNDLFGFDINVTWADNTLITFNNGVFNSTLDSIWGAGNWFVVLNTTGGGGGGGFYRLVALSTHIGFSGSNHLFDISFKIMRSGNFELQTPIHIDGFKLSDSNYTPIPATTVDGLFQISGTTPDLELNLIEPIPSKPFEYCKTFEVEVYATHVTHLTDFALTIQFDSELLSFVHVDYWGVFGTGSFSSTTGLVQVSGSGAAQTGDSLLLFALTFHIEFDQSPTHIWRVGHPQQLTAQISVVNTVGELSFTEGTIPITGVTLLPPLTVTVNLIRGDVDCNGKVDVFDLRTVAAYYDQSAPTQYDLTNDGTIDIFDLVVVATNFGYGGP